MGPREGPAPTPVEHTCPIPKVSSTLGGISDGEAKGRPGPLRTPLSLRSSPGGSWLPHKSLPSSPTVL